MTKTSLDKTVYNYTDLVEKKTTNHTTKDKKRKDTVMQNPYTEHLLQND